MVEIELKYSVIHIPTFQPPLQASAGTSAGDTALPLSQATRRGAGGGLPGWARDRVELPRQEHTKRGGHRTDRQALAMLVVQPVHSTAQDMGKPCHGSGATRRSIACDTTTQPGGAPPAAAGRPAAAACCSLRPLKTCRTAATARICQPKKSASSARITM